MNVYEMKRGDTRPSLEVELRDRDGAVDLSGATVRFKAKTELDGHLIIDAEATLVDAENGIVRYEWDPQDTAEAGSFLCEWEVTFGDGGIATWPNNEEDGPWDQLIIYEDL